MKKKTTKKQPTVDICEEVDTYSLWLKRKQKILNNSTMYAIIMSGFYCLLPVIFLFLYEITQYNLMFSVIPVVSLAFVPLVFFAFYDFFHKFLEDHDAIN
jgi:hypothetical protein